MKISLAFVLSVLIGSFNSFSDQIDLARGQSTKVGSTMITCENPAGGKCDYFSQIGQVVCGIECKYFYQIGQVKCADSEGAKCDYFPQIGDVKCGVDCQYFSQIGQVKCAREE
jgi:hypothetical protein